MSPLPSIPSPTWPFCRSVVAQKETEIDTNNNVSGGEVDEHGNSGDGMELHVRTLADMMSRRESSIAGEGSGVHQQRQRKV